MELYSQSSFSHFIIFVAGIVNVTGVLSVQTLTTNITGHFAYFAEEIMKRDYAAQCPFCIHCLLFCLVLLHLIFWQN
jgi:uncharacterized membrane protein YoaK (UPF0700 family)